MGADRYRRIMQQAGASCILPRLALHGLSLMATCLIPLFGLHAGQDKDQDRGQIRKAWPESNLSVPKPVLLRILNVASRKMGILLIPHQTELDLPSITLVYCLRDVMC